MPAPPEGTITFLFTDIAGSSSRFERHGEAMHAALARHDKILRELSESHGGYPFKTWGDAFFVAFPTAPQAVATALEAQRSVTASAEAAAVGGLPVRMVLHTGAAEYRNGDYYGDALNRTDRLLKIANGGQILLSGSAADLAEIALPEGCELKDLGQHRLRDLQRAERVYQLRHPELPSDFPPLRSLGYLPTNLPQQLTSFIGREREIEQVKTFLSKTRILTLTGSGGCGKTRLALQAAAEVLDEYPDGVWMVELAALREAELVSRTVGAALGLSEEPGQDAASTLSQYLRARKLLLILDNCEHLVDAVASLAESLLRDCASLRVLTTSREGLAVEGETVWRVPSLPVPKLRSNSSADLDVALNSESVRLFVDRARSASPGFQLSPSGAFATVDICRKLDGIPLAIELAAAMVNVLSPEQIAERLVDFFRVLTRGHRTALPRQKTLLGAIQWSYDLLTEPQRILLRRLSVFQSGWSLEAAEEVCDGDGIDSSDVLDLLTCLVEKSLVIVDEQRNGPTRYRLLETVRQFGLQMLQDAEEDEKYSLALCKFITSLAEEAESGINGPGQMMWLDRLENDHDNIRFALKWVQSRAERLRIACALWRYWYIRGHWSEGRGWLGAALGESASGSNLVWSKALNGLGVLCGAQHDFETARLAHEKCLELRRNSGDRAGIAGSLSNLGMLYHYMQRNDEARRCYEQSYEIYRELGLSSGEAMVTSNLGNLALEAGDFDVARQLYESSLAIYRQVNDTWCLAAVLHNLGETLFRRGDIESARRALVEGLELERSLGDPSSMANTLWYLSLIEYRCGRQHSGARIVGTVLETWEALGQAMSEEALKCYEMMRGELDTVLGKEERTRIITEGRATPLLNVVNTLLTGGN